MIMGEGKKKEEEKKKDEGRKKGGGATTIVLKADLHCDGCSKKIFRLIKRFQGVEKVSGDMTTNKITVIGKVDPTKLKQWLETKSKKKFELISPQPKKDKEGGGDDKKAEKKSVKKTKEPTVNTVVLETLLHDQGCIEKMQETIYKIKGVEEVKIDAQKVTVTVKGTMAVKALQPYLQDKLKRSVDVVPPRKDDGGGEKKDKGSGEKKGKGSAGGGGGGGGGGDGEKKKQGGEDSTVKRVESHVPKCYGHQPYYFVGYVPPPQIFSDDNPNACSIL